MLSRKSLFKVIAAFVMVSLTIAPALIGFKCGLSAPDLATNSSNFAALDNFDDRMVALINCGAS